jgi:ketosteroid isomerase-like protein
MSDQHVNVVRAIYDAFNRGEPGGILELADPSVRVDDHAVIDGASYEGHDGVLSFLAFQAEAFDAQAVELEEVLDAGNPVIAVVRLRGAGPLTRIPLEGRFCHVWDIAGGLVRRLRVYATKQEGLEAAGLQG